MALTIEKNISASYAAPKTSTSPWKRFINWADKQEEHRFGWTAFTIAGHGCVFTILTLVSILLSGNNFIFWPFAMLAMAVPLIANLSALPTRITIPILFVSILVDVSIIAFAFIHGIDSSILNA